MKQFHPGFTAFNSFCGEALCDRDKYHNLDTYLKQQLRMTG